MMKIIWRRLGLFLKEDKKGIILLDIILAITIFGIVIMVLLNIFNSINLMSLDLFTRSKSLKDLNHIFEFIILQINDADNIYYTNEVKGFNRKFKNNIGFIIETTKYNSSDVNYSSYYIRQNKLIRVANNTLKGCNLNAVDFKGHNVLADGVESFEGSDIDLESNFINLYINMSNKDIGKNRYIYLNHQVDFYE